MTSAVLHGISALVNKENVRQEIRSDPALKSIETRLLNEGKLDKTEDDVEEKLMKELQSASKALGISLGDGDESDDADDYDKPRDSTISSKYDSKYTSGRDTRENNDTPADIYEYPGGELQSRTMEHQRREHISNILGGTSGTFSFENERREDDKLEMLAEIDDLKQVLANTQADLSRLPDVGPDSEYDTVEKVLKILRHKNNMERGCTMAEELILLVTYAAEEAFNGDNEYFGYKPNIKGYHNHVSAKFRRMRPDTSQAMNTILQEFNIPTPIKMLIEFIPGAIMYSHTKSRQASSNHTEKMNTNTRNMRANS